MHQIMGANAEATDVTLTLARYLVAARFDDLPAGIRKEAARSLLNWMSVAVGGSRHKAVEIALAAVTPFSGPAQATIFGRTERLDIMHAAMLRTLCVANAQLMMSSFSSIRFASRS